MARVEHSTRQPMVLVAWGWIACLALFGGTAQPRELHNILIEVAATLLLAFHAWRRPELFRPRGTMALVYAAVGLLAVQLLPLPYAIWSAMPGHDVYARALHVASMPDTMRPWSVVPDLTLGALTGLLPVAASVATFGSLDARQRRALIVPLTIVLLVGAVLGIIQMAQGAESPLRLYRTSTEDGPTGFFSNRNHHALSLAIGIAYSVVAARFLPTGRKSPLAPLLGLGVAAMLSVAVLVAGSRGALLAAVPALLFLVVPIRSTLASLPAPRRRWFAVLGGGALVVVCGLVAVVLFGSDRALSIIRLWRTAAQDELRWRTFRPVLDVAWTYFPFGSGFGTFETAFRAAEPMTLLKPTVFNEAHDEPLQVLVEGGVAGVVLMIAAVAAVIRAAVRGRHATGDHRLFGLVGLVVLAQLGLVSLADFPLRTALLASVALLAYGWVRDASGEGARSVPSSAVA